VVAGSARLPGVIRRFSTHDMNLDVISIFMNDFRRHLCIVDFDGT